MNNIDVNVNNLYNYLIDPIRNVLNYNEKYYYPRNVLNPKISIISTEIKSFKKHIILKTIQKLKINKKIVNEEIKIIFYKKIISHYEIDKLDTFSTKCFKHSKLKINYNVELNIESQNLEFLEQCHQVKPKGLTPLHLILITL